MISIDDGSASRRRETEEGVVALPLPLLLSLVFTRIPDLIEFTWEMGVISTKFDFILPSTYDSTLYLVSVDLATDALSRSVFPGSV